MPTTRNKKGRYASYSNIVHNAVGVIVILSVVCFYFREANNALDAQVEALKLYTVELQVRAGELERISAELHRPAPLAKKVVKIAKVTAYSCGGITNAKEKLMNCPNGITASGNVPVPGTTVACDRSLLGKKVQIKGVGTRICQDTGGAIKGDKIDLYVENISVAYSWGVRHLEYSLID